MRRYVVLWKGRGETPLQALTKWKGAHSDYANVPAAYAGRLDPMAEGKLLVLLGDECKQQEKYHGLDKEYEIEVLIDAGSDTGDALGLIEYSGQETRVDPAILTGVLNAERGRHERAYPIFSSKTVNGKPLFQYVYEGTIDSVEIPKHVEHLYVLKKLAQERIGHRALRRCIDEFLEKVPTTEEESKALGANFRIDAVRKSWNNFFAKAGAREFSILKLRIVCGSGTYMRSLAGRIGKALGTKALALSIRRTKIGRRWCGFWMQSF